MTEEIKKRIVDMYTVDLKGAGTIARILNISEHEIRAFLKERKLMRSMKDAQKIMTGRPAVKKVPWGTS